MAQALVVRVPDIGEFENVDVVEVLVAVGDRIEADQALIGIESEKASMEIPSPAAGVVEALAVAPGAKVSEGAEICTLRTESAVAEEAPAGRAPAPAARAPAAPKPRSEPSREPAAKSEERRVGKEGKAAGSTW